MAAVYQEECEARGIPDNERGIATQETLAATVMAWLRIGGTREELDERWRCAHEAKRLRTKH